MPNVGFFCPGEGYWETPEVPPIEILGAYPEGTFQVPLRPSLDHQPVLGTEDNSFEWVFITPAPPAPEVTIAQFQRAIDAHVEAVAVSWQFNSAATLASYVNSTVPQWRAEAKAFIPWRDAVWVSAIETLAQVTAGEEPIPESPAAFIATLPVVTRPEAPYPED